MPLPEIKTRQNQGKPVLNTAQQQMQRSFVKARQEKAAQKQNEQSESPNNYAEEKISRTAENAVRDGVSLAVREIRSLHQRNDDKHGISSEADMPEEYQKTPAKGPSRSRPATQQEAGWKAAVQRIVQQQQANATGGVPESSDALPHRTAQKPIRTREQSIAVPAQTAQQEAARKAAVQNIVRQRQTQKQEKLQIEQAHFSQQVEASKRNSSTIPLPDSQAVFKPMDQTRSSTVGNAKADGFHNTVSLDKGTASKAQIPIKKKSDLPIRTKQGAVPIKTAEWASERIVDSTAEKAFQEAQKATITAAQKSSHAAACKQSARFWMPTAMEYSGSVMPPRAGSKVGQVCGRGGKGTIHSHCRRWSCFRSGDRYCCPHRLRCRHLRKPGRIHGNPAPQCGGGIL